MRACSADPARRSRRAPGGPVFDAFFRLVADTSPRAASPKSSLPTRYSPSPKEALELHRLLPDGTRRFLGGTCRRAFFDAGLRPAPGEAPARFELRAVGELYNASTPVTVTHTW